MQARHTKRYIILSLFLMGLALRIFLIPNRGFEADVAFWKSWGLSALDNGVVEGIAVTNNNYPTPFSYLLAALAFLYRLVGNPHDFPSFWNSGNVLFLAVAKLPSIIADMGIACLFLLIASARKLLKNSGLPELPMGFALVLSALYLFNPVSLMDGALWGQVDSLGVFVFLVAVLLAVCDKPLMAGAVFMLSMMTKLQNMIYGPLLFLLLWQLGGWRGLIRGITGALGGFIILNAEFFLKGRTATVIDSLTSNYDYFPLMSLNAFNLWWIAAKGQGMQMSDKFLSVGILNAKSVGLILFSGGYLLAVLTLIQPALKHIMRPAFRNHSANGTENTPIARTAIIGRFMTGLIIICLSFFLFQTESHDRYAFPVSVFFLLWGYLEVYRAGTGKNNEMWWKTNTFRMFIIGYSLFSFLFFLNLHTALSYNYPMNSIPALLFLKSPVYTIPISLMQVAFFFWFLVMARRQVGIVLPVISGIAVIIALVIPNRPLLTKTPVSLTALTPSVSQQGYGMRTTNRAVSIGTSSKQWNRLSVQYSFYTKGIGTHASSYIVYDLGGLFKRFTADVGVDTQAGSKGTVVFKIFGDDRLLYQSDTVKRFEYPRHVDIDITGVKKFALIVDDGGDGITDDHADWLNPLLYP